MRPGEFRTALAKVKARLGDSVSLGVVYFPVQMDPLALHGDWRAVFEAPLVGASTAGAAFTERGSTHTGVVAGVFAETDVSVAIAENLGHTKATSLADVINAAAGPGSQKNGVLCLADPFACDGETIVAALRTSLPAHTRAFGGSAGDDNQFEAVKLLINGQVRDDAAVFAALTFPSQVGIYVRHGFVRPDDAREMVVTEAEGAQLIKLDGRPAVEVYEQELGRLGMLKSGEGLLQTLANHSLSMRTPFGEGLLVRTPIGIRSDGSLRLTTAVPVGQQVSVVTTTRDRLIAAARWLRSQIESFVPNPSGLLVFDCGGRRAMLGQAYDKAIEAFHGTTAVPMLGIASYGEIAKFGGSAQGFHNAAAVMVGW